MGLQLFELAPHLVDGLVELLHPILKRGILLGGWAPWLTLGLSKGVVEELLRASSALVLRCSTLWSCRRRSVSFKNHQARPLAPAMAPTTTPRTRVLPLAWG